MQKLAIVAAPLIVYLVALGVRRALGRMPSRQAINVETSVLLVVYLFVTAGLGVFWVANQQLPPFDWHYLFGYLTLTLVAVHLFFNLRIVWRHLRRDGAAARARVDGPAASVGRALLVAAAIAAAFFAGARAGSTEIKTAIGGAPSADAAAILDYHAFSSHTRASVVMRAPSVAWGDDVPPYLDRSRLPATPLPRCSSPPAKDTNSARAACDTSDTATKRPERPLSRPVWSARCRAMKRVQLHGQRSAARGSASSGPGRT